MTTNEPQTCIAEVYEDAQTNEIVIRPPSGGCTPGSFERLAAKMATQGVAFRQLPSPAPEPSEEVEPSADMDVES